MRPRHRRLIVAGAALLVAATIVVAWRGRVLIDRIRPWSGEGVVTGKLEERGRPVRLKLDSGAELPVIAIASRIDAGDRVAKRAGELAYEINGERVSPVPTLVGSLLFFWLFLPAIAFAPAAILMRTRET